MSDKSIASIARVLAAALLAAAEKHNAHEEPQQNISALEKELIETYREEIIETVRV